MLSHNTRIDGKSTSSLIHKHYPADTAAARHRRPIVLCGNGTGRPSRWMKVVEAQEYTFYFGYNGAPSSLSAATAAGAAAGAGSESTLQASQSTMQQLQQQQKLAHQISSAACWSDLLQLAEQHKDQLSTTLWFRLLFRLCTTLHELDWQAVDLQDLLHDRLPPLLAAVAAGVEGLTPEQPAQHTAATVQGSQQQQHMVSQQQQQHMVSQQQQQQHIVSQLADMLYALAVLATVTHGQLISSNEQLVTGLADMDRHGSSSSSSCSAATELWYQCPDMQRLLQAVAAYGACLDLAAVCRKDAVSLIWAYGKLLQLQQHVGLANTGEGYPRSSTTPGRASVAEQHNGSSSHMGNTSIETQQQFVSKLCRHIADLIQLSNNTSDSASAAATAGIPSSSGQITEPWHPEDLTDAVNGLAAAAAAPAAGSAFRGRHPGHRAQQLNPDRFKGPAAAALLDATAHEVYRQLSNRHSAAGSFNVDSVVDLLQGYCSLDYRDGPSLRMFDAAAGWVVKRIRARHMHAPSSPQQLAAVASVFAQLQHKSVVVPELLNALSSQACKATAAAVELAAEDPVTYHQSSSSSYCHWLPEQAATLLRSFFQLGYMPPETLITCILTALMLHWDFNKQLQQHEPGTTHQQQQQQQAYEVELLDVLSQLGHLPSQRVLTTLLQQAWDNNPESHLPRDHLVLLLFSSARLVTLAGATTPAAGTDASASPAASLFQSQPSLLGSEGTAASTSPEAAPAGPAAAAPKLAAPDLQAVSAVADELILASMPEQQPRRSNRLSLAHVIRVLWSLCTLGCLDIAQYGWLLTAVAAGAWQGLNEQQLLVIKRGQLMLGQDGEDMATEVLPAQLLARVDTAWEKQGALQSW